MDVVALTRQLVDIESTSGDESRVADFLHRELSRLGYRANKMPVSAERCNVFATSPQQARPDIVFSTHMDTVPPFIPSSEDDTRIYGRGACDAKAIIAAQIAAAEQLRQEGIYVGLLFVVGEEKDSLGAKIANQQSPGCKFLVNGEPTENRMASASKGTLRVEISAAGRMAHSAYPELGESAIDKLLEALNRLKAIQLPSVEGIGPCTVNIGVIEGGRAPNVIPDKARAQLLYRLVGPSDKLREEIVKTVEFALPILVGMTHPEGDAKAHPRPRRVGYRRHDQSVRGLFRVIAREWPPKDSDVEVALFQIGAHRGAGRFDARINHQRIGLDRAHQPIRREKIARRRIGYETDMAPIFF